MTDLLLWLDFEATGLNGPGDPMPHLLEAAWTITRGPDLEPVRSGHRYCWDQWFAAEQLWEACHPAAEDMHRRSGLVHDWWLWAVNENRRGNLAEVDAAILTDVTECKAAFEADRVAVAGSGVGPYDVPLLRHYLPATATAVHYRPVDISSVRAFARLYGVEAPFDEKDRPHRATGDVQRSIDEARWWANRLFGETGQPSV